MDDPIETASAAIHTPPRRLTLVPKATSSTHGRTRSDDVVTYQVAGLPRTLAIDIAEFDGRWQLLVVRDGLHGDWQGDFESPDAALAAIERELSGFERPSGRDARDR